MAIVIKDKSGKIVDNECGTGNVKVEPIPTKLTLNVPFKLVQMLKDISDLDNFKSNEYAVCYRVKKEGLVYTIEDDSFYIPTQSVTPGHVRIETSQMSKEEQGVLDTCNGVVHKHPRGVRSFSTTDDLDLNKLFEVSLLFLPPYDLPTAIINISINGETLQLVPEINVISSTTTDDMSIIFKNGVLHLQSNQKEIDKLSTICAEKIVERKYSREMTLSKFNKLSDLWVENIDTLVDNRNIQNSGITFKYVDLFKVEIYRNSVLECTNEFIEFDVLGDNFIELRLDVGYNVTGKISDEDLDHILEDYSK